MQPSWQVGAIPYLQLEQPKMSPYIGQYPGGRVEAKTSPHLQLRTTAILGIRA